MKKFLFFIFALFMTMPMVAQTDETDETPIVLNPKKMLFSWAQKLVV